MTVLKLLNSQTESTYYLISTMCSTAGMLTWKYLLMKAIMSFINDLICMAGNAEYVMLSILGNQAAQVMV